MGGGGEGPVDQPFPFARRVQNTGNTLFLVRGITTNSALKFRIKWPSGRFLTQTAARPFSGFGANQFALENEIPIEQGGRISIEVAELVSGGTLQVAFWGVLRYLLKTTSSGRLNSQVSCIVGYPAEAKATLADRAVSMMPDPILTLRDRPRYWCGPNQNIMAPEFLLGDQEPDTPAGYIDEAFTFFSDPISVALNSQALENATLIPGREDVVIRGMRPISAWGGDVFTTVVYSLRTPSGYSVTGGDLIPADGTYEWLPLFPPLKVRAGERLILDVSNIDGTGTEGNTTTEFEFNAVKRRKVGA